MASSCLGTWCLPSRRARLLLGRQLERPARRRHVRDQAVSGGGHGIARGQADDRRRRSHLCPRGRRRGALRRGIAERSAGQRARCARAHAARRVGRLSRSVTCAGRRGIRGVATDRPALRNSTGVDTFHSPRPSCSCDVTWA